METKDFFQEALSLTYKQNLTRDLIDKFCNNTYLEAETTRLKFYLMDKDKEDRVIVATWIMDKLLQSYYGAREKINPQSSFDINRYLMSLYEALIVGTGTHVLWTLKIKLDEDFIREWELKTDYFPFKFLFEGKPMPFIEREKREKLSDNGMVLPKELDTDEAKEFFNKVIKAGFMDNNYKFVGTWYQAAYFAEIAAEKLNLKCKWKYFQILWGYDKLAQTRRESKERFGKVDKQDEIDRLFD